MFSRKRGWRQLHTSQRLQKAFAGAAVFVLLGLVVFLGWKTFLVQAVSDTRTLTSQTDWEAGEYYPGSVDTKSSAGDLKISAGAGGAWDAGTPGFITSEEGFGQFTYDQVSYGGDLTTDGYYIYITTGNRRPYLIRYNPELNSFKFLSNAPTSFLYGGSIAYYGGAIYAIDGGEQNESGEAIKHLYKYDIATDTWSRLADAPDAWGLGSDIVSDGNGKLYAVRGFSTARLWSYNIGTDTWDDTLPAIPTYQVYTTNGHPLEFVNESYGDPAVCTQGCLFAFRGNNNLEFFRFDIAESQWSVATSIPAGIGGTHYGSAMAYNATDGNIYAFRGNNNDEFMKYDVSAGAWDADTATTPDAPDTVYNGGALVFLNNFIYALRGNTTNEFWRYDATNGYWDSISAPANLGNDSEDGLMVFVPSGTKCADATGCLFLAQGENTTNFWRYNIAGRTWDTLTAVTGALRQGSSLCYEATNGYIYVLQGNNTLNFYRYTVVSGGAGSWTTMSSMPSTQTGGNPGTATNARYGASITCMGTTVYATKGNNSNHFFSFNGSAWAEETLSPYNTYYGAAIGNDGTYIYAIMGYNRGEFHRYQPGVGWTALAPLPTGAYYSSEIKYDGTRYFYAVSGDYRKYFWRYDKTGNTWERSIGYPERTNGYNASLSYDTGTNTLYATRGFNTQAVYKANMTTNVYPANTSWISSTTDLTYVQSFTSFSATETTPGSSSITYQSRTSTDKVNWSSWQTISAGSISSPARRYIQIKVILNSDGTNSPTLSDYAITFEKDSDDPTNPTVAGYSDSTMATGITTGNSYYYPTPYFELSGATDTSSQVAGYYVLWTTGPTDDPAASEDYYQTGETYEVNTDLVSGTAYYLRIKTKDAAGNVSAATTGFTYTYTGISPAATQTWSVQADFAATGTTASNINTNAGSGTSMTLSSVAQGVWMDLPATFGTATYNYTAYNDTALAFDGDDTIFALRSVNTKSFYKYTISTQSWSSLADITSTANVYYGSSIVYIPNGTQCTDASGCVFALVGNSTTEFLRYDISANTWTARANFGGSAVYYGGSLAWGGGDYIYALRGNNSTEFYRYSINLNSWVARTATPYAFYYGASMEYVPNGEYCDDASGCLFAFRGNNTSQFYRYDISGNSWTSLTAFKFNESYGATLLYHDGYLYALRGGQFNSFLRYDILNDRWDPLAYFPSTRYMGSSNGMVYDSNTDMIYALRGYNEYAFYGYDVTNDKWVNGGIPHDTTSNGFYYGGVTYDGTDTLYIARGNNTTDFYKYTISTGIYTRLMDSPIPFYISADIVYVNGKVYGAGSYNKDNESKMYVYDVATDKWSISTNAAPAWLGYGSNLVNGGNGKIYATRGQNTLSFYAYTIATNTWEATDYTIPSGYNVYQGGCAVKAGSYIYQIRAQNTADILRFNIGTETWDAGTTLTDAPGNIYQGDACAYDGGDLIYVPAGTNANTNFYVYSISGNSWETGGSIRSTNNEYWYYGALVGGPNGILYGFRGYNTSALTRYVPSSSTTGFKSNGTWMSQILDLGSIYGFGGLTVNDTVATNTSLKYETRTCSDSGCAADPDDAHWSDWDEVSNSRTIGTTDYYNIASSAAQYAQIRVTFLSDRMYTPTVNDLTISYYSDGEDPSNPDTLTAKSQASGGVDITTGNWYNYSAPYFSWTGAYDNPNPGGIGIEGYCVYFGINASADPASGCTPQSAATYTASGLSTTQTYYLRIKTRDYAGNTSDDAWAPFTYSYDNVAPSRPTNLSASPAVPSATNSFNFTWTAGSDSGGSPAFQYCYRRYVSDIVKDANDTCIASSNTSLTGIQALQQGVNYLQIRSKDTAGNYSNSGEYESVAYRWAQTPPTLPPNVEHGAVEGDDYSHTFAWNEPTSHAFDISAYCYQINEVPTASYCNNSTYGRWTTSVETAGRFLSAFRTPNTQPGTNYFYVVAKDEAGLVNWDAEFDCATGLGCISFESDTLSPNTPQSFSLADASNRDAQSYRLTLGWKKPADNPGSVLYRYNIYRSTDNATFALRESLLHVDGQDEYAYTDVSLDNTTTYYYKVTASDLAGAESDYTTTLSAKPEGKYTEPPDLVGNPSIQPRIRSALIEWLTEPSTHPASSFVQYGLTTEYGGEQGSSDLVSSHTVTIIDLEPASTYHFRLKWVDQDGNIGYSPDYTFTTNDAPSPPINLTVDPASNTVNRFTFDWSPPADEGVTISGYFYSINNIPTEENTSFVTDSDVGPIAAATQQGTNTFYVIAVDDVGNTNYANYASIEFTVHTAAPDEPQNVTIVDSSDRNAKRYNITLTWDPPLTASAADDESGVFYTIYRSINEGKKYSDIARITSTGYLDTGLDNTIEYYYKIVASDKAGAASKATTPVSEIPEGRYTEPPEITKDPTAAPDSYSAVISWRTDRVASSFVEFGLTDKLGEEQGTAEQIIDHEVNITGLKPLTKYYYLIKSIDIDENIAYSEIDSFTTLEAPRVAEVVISDVRLFDAVINWKTNKETTTIIDYGTTTQYGQTYTDTGGSYTFTHTVKLERLTDGTTYHLRMAGTDSNNNPVQSDDYSFTTLTFPKITDVSFQNKAEGETEVTWKTNVPTTSTVEYWGEQIPPKTQGNTALVTEHAVLLFGLEDATVYLTKIHGIDQFSYEAITEQLTFTTLEDTTPPIISNVKSESNTIGSGDASTIQIVISWVTNEKCTSKVEYGEGFSDTYSGATDENAELVSEHLMVVTKLAPARTYHFRVVSFDKAGNESKSDAYSVLTSIKRPSFLTQIVDNLAQTFSWIGNLADVFR